VARYDPDKHHRRSIRLQGYDYTQSGAYFVTIVTHGRELLFDDPVLRRVAETMWQRIPRHFPHVELDEWVVMPNHVHGIIVIAPTVRPPIWFAGCHRRQFQIGDGPARQSHPQDPRHPCLAAQLLRAHHLPTREGEAATQVFCT